MTRAAAGFSLIELVIVITIVSVLALTVTLGFATQGRLTGTREASPARAAAALEAGVTRARDLAILARAPAGLRPDGDGWEILRHEEDGWRRIGGGALPDRSEWRIDGQLIRGALTTPETDEEPPVRFLPDGRSTPFELRLGPRGAAHRCATSGPEPLECRAE